MTRTPDEIKKGLANNIPVHYHPGDNEPRLTPLMMVDLEELHADALAYISQLESQNRCFKEIKESCEKRMIEMAQRMPRWISVEERLPEAHKTVLVYMTNPIGWWNVEIDWMDEQGWVCSADSEWHTITHWMPLPKPPKEDAK